MAALTISTLLLLSGFVSAHFNVPSSYRVDVHTHIIPDFYREALIAGGSEIRNGSQLWSEGTIIPNWSFDAHLQTMDDNGIDYSVLSISAPGVAFLHGNPAAVNLTRRLNNYMFNLTQQHPTRIGAFCIIPLPNVEAALEEIDVKKRNRSKLFFSLLTHLSPPIVLPKCLRLRWRWHVYKSRWYLSRRPPS